MTTAAGVRDHVAKSGTGTGITGGTGTEAVAGSGGEREIETRATEERE